MPHAKNLHLYPRTFITISAAASQTIPAHASEMASTPVPRFLLPRPYLPLLRHQRALQRQPALLIASRNASSKSTRNEKPIVLEKPDKFRPPSHGARLPPRKQPQYTYGARLTDEQIAEQKTKQYPHMMPPEGSFTHWVLTNRMLHTWISLVRLAPSA